MIPHDGAAVALFSDLNGEAVAVSGWIAPPVAIRPHLDG